MNYGESKRQAASAPPKATTLTQPAPTPLSELRPAEPPGRRSRKARSYGDQIRQLQAAGYSLELIREALADAGVIVSKSTVQREAARQRPSTSKALPPRAIEQEMPAAKTSQTVALTSGLSSASTSKKQRGREVAEAFMSGRITNPLLRKGNP